MNKKISTKDAQIYIATHYLRDGIDSVPEDWELTKKYKNHKGITCRDFYNKEKEIKAIFTSNEDCTKIEVVEGENYEYFIKLLAEIPVFYYVPTICNDGLVFVFESVANFDKTGEITKNIEDDNALLRKKLLTLFKDEDIFYLNKGLFFAFPNTDMDEVIRKLERNQMTFNLALANCLDPNSYQSIIPDITLAAFRFPEDELINQEQAIDIIFTLVSTQENLIIEDYARIKFLLKKIRQDEFPGVKRITLGFKKNKDQKLNSLFDSETNRKKAQELIKDVCSQR